MGDTGTWSGGAGSRVSVSLANGSAVGDTDH